MKAIYLAVVLMCILAVQGQGGYAVDWFKVAAGGGASSNGQYSVNGTLGQPDAGGPLTGGPYSVMGGFWAITAVPTPEAPPLVIVLVNSTTVKVSWPSPSTGFVLQETGNISSSNWANFLQATNDDGITKSVLISPPAGQLFFRLKKPATP